MPRLKNLRHLLRNLDEDHKNLHRIAISNLSDPSHIIFRWWHKKYRVPPKQYDEYIEEDLVVEFLEDFYALKPERIQEFEMEDSAIEPEDDWDGSMPEGYEEEVQRRLAKVNQRLGVDIKKYQDDTELTEEEEQKILDNLGKRLPGSTIAPNQRTEVKEDEFDDEFGDI